MQRARVIAFAAALSGIGIVGFFFGRRPVDRFLTRGLLEGDGQYDGYRAQQNRGGGQ
jgi:hypothetical protein